MVHLQLVECYETYSRQLILHQLNTFLNLVIDDHSHTACTFLCHLMSYKSDYLGLV